MNLKICNYSKWCKNNNGVGCGHYGPHSDLDVEGHGSCKNSKCMSINKKAKCVSFIEFKMKEKIKCQQLKKN